MFKGLVMFYMTALVTYDMLALWAMSNQWERRNAAKSGDA